MAKKSLVAESQTITKDDIGTVVLTSPAAVPDIYQPAGPVAVVAPATTSNTPYMVFGEPKSQSVWTLLTTFNPNVAEGQPVLILPSPYKPEFLNPFRLYLVTTLQYWADMDDQNNLLRASLTKTADAAFEERNEAVVIVDTGERLIPANLSCTSVKSGLIHKISSVAAIANTPQWGEITPEHKATLQIADYRFRFLTTVKINKRIGKASKRPYFAADGVCNPVTEAEYARAVAFWADADQRAGLANVAETYQRRRASIIATAG